MGRRRAPSLPRALALLAAFWGALAEGSQRRAAEGGLRRRSHRVQHGRCSYTFVLPEAELPPCGRHPGGEPFDANTLQRDAPLLGPPPPRSSAPAARSAQRVQQLERVLENNTQWLLKPRGVPYSLPSSLTPGEKAHRKD
ncbi:UNVERIFIED_CONTAM: hypothetical protein K2H54_074027 [Gekko kuhli]